MAADIHFDFESGDATISVTGVPSSDKTLKFALQNVATGEYLTASGWIKVRKNFSEVTNPADPLVLSIGKPLTQHIKPGTRLILDEIFISFREELRWPDKPSRASKPAPVIAPVTSATVEASTNASDPELSRQSSSGRSWLMAAAGVLLGAAALVLIIRLTPETAALVLPQTSVPSPELLQREAKVAASERDLGTRDAALRAGQDAVASVATRQAIRQAEIDQQGAAFDTRSADLRAKERTQGGEAQALRVERDQLRKDVQAAQTQLTDQKAERALAEARASEREKAVQIRDAQIQSLRAQLSARPATTTSPAAPSIPNPDLAQQLENLKVDSSMLQARINEQEKLLASRSAEIATLQNQLSTRPNVSAAPPEAIATQSGPRLSPDVEIQDARRLAADLRQEGIKLQTQIGEKEREIATWKGSSERNAVRIRELEQQVANLNSLLIAANQDKVTWEAKASELQASADARPSRRFGAIASASNGIVFLTPDGAPTENEANERALGGCRNFAGGAPCKVERVFSGTCAAVARVEPATRQQRWHFELGRNADDAEEMAMSECYQYNHRACKITVRAVCL